ncbi:hypothetical protein GBAR_LOCUS23115 [Geodia barretti]|uniref:Uncharacterized protein n=1 Tax=Geodia barretti TaxID=519541 RepID=A0AA35X807_GEOBA|nr:hypothetical protein GBAR_LOCUS23115 [Geodia barretti]
MLYISTSSASKVHKASGSVRGASTHSYIPLQLINDFSTS